MTRKVLAILSAGFLALISFSLVGCPKLEKDAYLAATGAKGFLDSTRSQHPECSTTNNETCEYIRKAVAAKDLLIDAGEIYCANPAFATGKVACTPPDKKSPAYQQARDKLQAALDGYEQAEKDLKAIISKGAN